uniref:Uncharacterized protein n=2 Tax=Lepeophtheirus salmonis TaxID=72036 RepID=A0A0K2VDU4_LEPSM
MEQPLDTTFSAFERKNEGRALSQYASGSSNEREQGRISDLLLLSRTLFLSVLSRGGTIPGGGSNRSCKFLEMHRRQHKELKDARIRANYL